MKKLKDQTRPSKRLLLECELENATGGKFNPEGGAPTATAGKPHLKKPTILGSIHQQCW